MAVTLLQAHIRKSAPATAAFPAGGERELPGPRWMTGCRETPRQAVAPRSALKVTIRANGSIRCHSQPVPATPTG